MPIKPENRALYPKDWPAISLATRAHAGWKCQHAGCCATQYSVGVWDGPDPTTGEWHWRPVEGNKPCATAQDRAFWMAGEGRRPDTTPWTYAEARDFIQRWSWDDREPIVIVLTVAHLNHDPTDCRPANLAAMCQRHHLAYDARHHVQTAYMSRMATKNNLELPL